MSIQERLHELFLVDQQLRGINARLSGATARLQAQQNKLDQIHRQRGELADQLKHTQAKASSLEHQADDLENRITQVRAQMNSVKHNKEYQALLVEVNTFKAEKEKLEDEALEHLGRIEQMRQELQQTDERAVEQEKLVLGAEAELKAAKGEVGQRVQELQTQRNGLEGELPAEVRLTFNRLVHVHEGEALASVVEESRRHMEYSCGGCYIGLPVERVNALMRTPDALVCCPSCGRILYLDRDLKEAIGTK
jgi:uncharacterized protein